MIEAGGSFAACVRKAGKGNKHSKTTMVIAEAERIFLDIFSLPMMS